MTQSPYGPDDALGQDPTPARAADWTDPAAPSYQASSGFVASSTDLPDTGASAAYSTGSTGSGDSKASQTADTAKSEAADLKNTAQQRGQDVAATAKEQASQVKDTALEQGQQVAGVAKEQATQVKDTALEQGQQVAGVAKEEVSKVAGEAVSQARELFAQGREELSSQAHSQQQRLASIVHGFADELGSMASSSDKSGPLTDLVHTGSRRGGELAHWLQESQPTDLLEEVKSFARRRPWAFLAGSALAGVVVGRLTRSLAAEAKADREAEAVTTGYQQTGSYASGYATDAPVSYGSGYAAGTTTGYESGSTTGYETGTTGYTTGASYTSAPTTPELYPDTPEQGGYAR